ncbi:4'-phosphopantetheinyl transferase family protein [Dyadobacter luticola]|nr:4'-phosphopantetheinyl transferase superfamily protein [Dyadobacter luticola]
MTESWPELMEMLDLSANDEQILNNKKKDIRKQEWLACRVLLKNMLQKDVEIGYHDDGKPFVKDLDLFLSMSHSGDFVSVYMDKKKSVGIDIQQLKPDISKGADFFLNEAEQIWADLENNVQLHTIWSAKEAVFKYAGNIDLDFKKHIITNPFSGNQNGQIEVKLLNENETETVQVQYENFENYVLTWTI